MKITTLTAYIIVLTIFNLLIWTTPLIYKITENKEMYIMFSPFCHQITQRSLCIYDLGIYDCYPQNIIYSQLTKEIVVENSLGTGYKLPVCSRDVSFFLSMLIGGIIIYFYKGDKYNIILPIWVFILFISPLAIDGITQLIGLRQSTNLLRIITGFMAGIILPFYIIGIINSKKINENNKKIHVKRKSTKNIKR